MGDQSAHGHQNVKDSTIQFAFTGQPMPERGLTASVVTVRFGEVIIGLGGVGKTQLAARYVHGDEYDIVAWIHVEDGGIVDLATMAVKLGERVEGLSPAERRDLALERLASGNECWLLVLDKMRLNPAGAKRRCSASCRNGCGRDTRRTRPAADRQVLLGTGRAKTRRA